MILWLTGNSGAGKTTLAYKLKGEHDIVLDGDEVRDITQVGFTLTKYDRVTHNLNVARWARLIESQGFDVIVALICPYEALRQEIKAMTGCKFIYIEFEGDDQIPDKPYEKPINPDIRIVSMNDEKRGCNVS